MAGKIILLDDFKEDAVTGTQSVSAVFIFELGPGEIKTVNGINAKPTSAAALFGLHTFLFQHNLISIPEQAKLDGGEWDFETVHLTRYPGEPAAAIKDKMKLIYVSKRAKYLAAYVSRYAFAGQEVPIV